MFQCQFYHFVLCIYHETHTQSLKYLGKDIMALSLYHVSHKYYKYRCLNYLIQLHYIGRKNFNNEFLIHRIRQNFPPSNICAI